MCCWFRRVNECMRLFLLCVAAISFPQTPPEPGLGQKKVYISERMMRQQNASFFFIAQYCKQCVRGLYNNICGGKTRLRISSHANSSVGQI